MEDAFESRVQALVHAGRHGAAADLCLAEGEVARAADLYAAVWQWDEAIRITEEHGLFDEAYRHALSAKDRAACGRLLSHLEEAPELAVRAAVHAEGKGRNLDAARLREAAGETAAAAELYERASEYRDAARCRLLLGEARQAGMLYERRLREDPDDAGSGLALGRILMQFGRYEHAVRALQRTLHDPVIEPQALRLMVACFAALGMDEAAGSRLDALRALSPGVPVTVPAFLDSAFGDPRGVAGLSAGDEGERLLAGRYRVVGPLGAGATGRVLRAHDAFFERDVAIKVLNVGGGATGRDAFVRFAREARVAAGIRHPHVVRVFEFNADGPFLVMELMDGTLEARLLGPDEQPRRYPPALTRVMGLAVLSALEAVHGRGVVHRDLKPGNVFFTEGGDVKLGDFGVAHLTDLGATLTGAMIGTLAYMAPEQITGEVRPNAATDLYAFGVILFRCLTGRLPFEGPDFVAQHLGEMPPRPSEVGALGTDAFDPLIAELLEKAPEARPASAGQVLDRFRALPFELLPDDGAAAAPARVTSPSVPPPATSAGRYVTIRQQAEGQTVARDELLERQVEIWTFAPEAIDRVLAFARADGPYLQAVYEVDREEGRLVLEHPTGVHLDQLKGDDPRRARAVRDVRSALTRLHHERVVHGRLEPSQVVVSEGRACVRLSLAPCPFDPALDWVALDRMGGRGASR